MADERDPKVSQRYRELGSEEPSRALDQAVLSAAHRAADKPHAPLVTPSGRHRWYFSLGAAAVIVLAVAVTYHMQQEAPDPDSIAILAAPEEEQRIDEAKPSKPKPRFAPDPKPRASEPARELARRPAAPPPPVSPPESESRGLESQRELAREAPGARSDTAGAAASRSETAATESVMKQRRAAPAELPAPAAAPAPPPAVGGLMSETLRYEPPERWLERIVQLRKEGKHEEAEKLLAEFRRRYPDYRIPENVVRP